MDGWIEGPSDIVIETVIAKHNHAPLPQDSLNSPISYNDAKQNTIVELTEEPLK